MTARICRPSQEELRVLIHDLRDQGVTYAEVGATRGTLPSGYRHDHDSVVLGRGTTFSTADGRPFVGGRATVMPEPP